MLLKYATSFVTKWQDGIGIDGLYLHSVSGCQTAICFVMQAKLAEQDMWPALSSTEISWSCSRTKRYAVFIYDWASRDKTVEKYRNRQGNMSEMSPLTWLRNVDHAKQQSKEYKSGTTLVRFKLLSRLNSQFFSSISLYINHTEIYLSYNIPSMTNYQQSCNGLHLPNIIAQTFGKMIT